MVCSVGGLGFLFDIERVSFSGVDRGALPKR